MTPDNHRQEDTMSVEVRSFSAHDRCDRCGSQALMVAEKPGYAELLFCNHHRRRHEDTLIDQGWTVTFDSATYESYREPVAV